MVLDYQDSLAHNVLKSENYSPRSHGAHREKKIDNLRELCVSVVKIDRISDFDIQVYFFYSLAPFAPLREITLISTAQ
jgi:hypothetical protein